MLFHESRRKGRQAVARREAARALMLEAAAGAPFFVWPHEAAARASSFRVVEAAARFDTFAPARAAARQLARQHGVPYVVRRAGVVACLAHPCGLTAVPKGALGLLHAESVR